MAARRTIRENAVITVAIERRNLVISRKPDQERCNVPA